ncbi:hypothetical protein DPMN_127611 [Dreissena polymorpha]|uniref:Uncharacterized protein n=1 Tax=Dreissena polymorpha TaxID=45954 RepID=A0A9D4GZ93_DREPO|nr:hypothetical protein DPMN_127611 [Dreissena polymorpha]
MDAMNDMNYRKRGTADYVHSRQKRMLIDIHSPTETTDTSEEPTNARSLCPWTYIYDVNITRYPRKLMKAVCNHNAGDNSCDFSSSRVFDAFPRIMDRLRLDTECEIVYGQIMVVYECCEDGNYSRIDEWVEWPVACACSRKRVRVVQPASRRSDN